MALMQAHPNLPPPRRVTSRPTFTSRGVEGRASNPNRCLEARGGHKTILRALLSCFITELRVAYCFIGNAPLRAINVTQLICSE